MRIKASKNSRLIIDAMRTPIVVPQKTEARQDVQRVVCYSSKPTATR